MDVATLVADIDAGLRASSTPERAAGEKAYLKSALEHYGTSVPNIRKVAKSASARQPHMDHDDLVSLVNALWREPVHERRMAAVELLGLHADLLRTDDIGLLERLLREARTWALVDPLAASVVGGLVERHTELGHVLDQWATDDDFWIRRSALLALLGPLRRGAGDFDRFGRYADALLEDKQFFVRKAIGWVLRETAKRRPDMVYEWALPRAGRMAGVTWREAVKPLSEEQRAAVAEAARAG